MVMYYLCVMGFFSASKNKISETWKTLSTLNQLSDIEKFSFEKPQIIFKHSTSCSISRMAKSRMEAGLEDLEKQADIYYLDLLANRSVSNSIAEKWNVEHESPQVLVIKNGVSVYDASHNMVSVDELKKNLL